MEKDYNIKTLFFFDFDDTLIESITPENGVSLYKKLTGKRLQLRKPWEWWDKEESLDVIFSFSKPKKKIQNIQKHTYLLSQKPNSTLKTILLTARKHYLSDKIKKVLNKFNLYFNHYSFKDKNRIKKAEIIENYYLNIYPNTEKIIIFDDRDKEIIRFTQLKTRLLKKGIETKIIHVK